MKWNEAEVKKWATPIPNPDTTSRTRLPVPEIISEYFHHQCHHKNNNFRQFVFVNKLELTVNRARHIFQNRLAIAGQLKYIYGTPKIEILKTRTQNRATAAGFPDFSFF